jgi:hypothetical protein
MERIVGIAEGRIEAAPAPAPAEGETAEAAAGADMQAETSDASGDTGDAAEADEAAGTAADLEEAGGAAELLGTGDADTRSPYETGDATGGGTPEDAPALDKGEK